jgi:hypothetical protein
VANNRCGVGGGADVCREQLVKRSRCWERGVVPLRRGGMLGEGGGRSRMEEGGIAGDLMSRE